MAKRKRRLKRKFRRLLKLLLFIIVILFAVLIFKKIKGKKYITSIEYNDNLIVNLIDNDDLYCMLSNDKPNIESNKWIKSDSNKCRRSITTTCPVSSSARSTDSMPRASRRT